MTELERLYSTLSSRGLAHHAALASMREATSIDLDSLDRSLKRARTEDARQPRNPNRRTDR
jgi:hypothetical protein